MLAEIKNAKQIPDEGFRRWFTDADNDLIVWYTDDHTILGFQYCYNKLTTERALTWFEKGGFSHTKVDPGEPGNAGPKRTPILVSDGTPKKEFILRRFVDISKRVEPDLVEFIRDRLTDLPDSSTEDIRS